MRLWKKKCCKKALSTAIAVIVAFGTFPTSEVHAEQSLAEKPYQYFEDERTKVFNDGWGFCLEPTGDPEEVNYDDSQWTEVTLPHDWSIYRDFENSVATAVGSLRGGNGWYRKSFVLPQNMDGKRISIDFDGVYQDSYIYVNGQLVGNYPNGYVPFSFDITDYVVCDGKTENVIAVSVTNVTNENKAGYTSRWYSGSGIYRDVYLTVTDPLHIERYGVIIKTPDLEKEFPSGDVTVNIQSVIQNESAERAYSNELLWRESIFRSRTFCK